MEAYRRASQGPLRSFKLPSEAHSSFNGRFTSELGLENRVYNTLPVEETLQSANDELARYGYEPIRSRADLVDPESLSSEVGDDEISLEKTRAGAAFLLVFHQKLGMKVSREDTCINSRFGNFAEDLVILPDGYGQTYHNARNTSGINDMSFLDVPKLRLAIDIRPMRMDHSGTNDGKASMVGSRQRWIPLESNIRGIYEMFSLYQDVNLGLKRDRKFAYMPVSLGGYGKEPPFRNYKNFERFLKSYRQGAHSELIRDIVHRTIDFLGDKEAGMDPPKDPLLAHVVRFQSSFHDWVKGHSIYAPITWLDVPPEVAKHQVLKLGSDPVLDEVATRLLAEGKLLSEQQLEIAVEHNELCKALLKTETIPEFKKIRDDTRMKWRDFSLFSMENYGMIEEITLGGTRGLLRPLKAIEVASFFSHVNAKRYNLKHLLRNEFVYRTEAMDEIYKVGPMSVNFHFLPLNKIGHRAFAAPRSDYKSDYEDTEMIGAYDELLAWLTDKVGRLKTPVPRRAVNDDNAIIVECAKHSHNIIITDDISLCRNAERLTGSVIFRVPVLWYYKSVYFGTKHWTEFLRERLPNISWTEHEDSGSIQSFEEKNFHDGTMLSRPRTQKFDFWKSIGSKDQFVLEEFIDFSDDPPTRIENLFHDRSNSLAIRARRKPTYRRSSQLHNRA